MILLTALDGSDLPPKKESNCNVSLEGQKGGTNGQDELHTGTDHQQAERKWDTLRQNVISIGYEEKIDQIP